MSNCGEFNKAAGHKGRDRSREDARKDTTMTMQGRIATALHKEESQGRDINRQK